MSLGKAGRAEGGIEEEEEKEAGSEGSGEEGHKEEEEEDEEVEEEVEEDEVEAAIRASATTPTSSAAEPRTRSLHLRIVPFSAFVAVESAESSRAGPGVEGSETREVAAAEPRFLFEVEKTKPGCCFLRGKG